MSKPTIQPVLSKSKLLSAHQCLKMLHLEWHHPKLAEVSEDTEAAYRTGHEVGAIAKEIYGTADSVEIPYRRGEMVAMVRWPVTRWWAERGLDGALLVGGVVTVLSG